MKRYAGVVIVCLLVFMYWFYFTGPDLSTPEATIRTGRNFLEQEKWEQLHGIFTEDFAGKIDLKVKQLLRFMAGRGSGKHTEDLRRLTALTARGRFAALLQALAEEPQTADILKKYQNAELQIEEQNPDTVLLKLNSEKKLPFREVKLVFVNGKWLIADFPDISW